VKKFPFNPIYLLMGFGLAAVLGDALGWSPLLVFGAAALSVIPLAALIGEGTEALAARTGPRLGGLLNATLGNAAELIITIVAIRAGLLELVKASITGSILGNLLLVMGASMLFGGLKHGRLDFDRRQAMSNAMLLVLSVIALTIPSLFAQSIAESREANVELLSLGAAGLMIILYGLGVLHSFTNADSPLQRASTQTIEHRPGWSMRRSFAALAVATAGVVWMSEILVGAVEPVVADAGVSEFFLGVILIPIVGNVAEHFVAIQVALKKHMDLSVEIALGSSLQVALFVAPVLVFASLAFGRELTLVFNRFELLALILGVAIAALVAADGESNWLEGAVLLAVYLMLGLAFFLLPV